MSKESDIAQAIMDLPQAKGDPSGFKSAVMQLCLDAGAVQPGTALPAPEPKMQATRKVKFPVAEGADAS